MNFRLMSGEVRSNLVKFGSFFSNKIGVYLIQVLTANSTVVFFVFVDGLDLPKIAIDNFSSVVSYFFGNLVSKN